MENSKKFISKLINSSQERVVWHKTQMQEVYKGKELYPEWYKEWLRELKNSEMIWLKSLQDESYWVEVDMNAARIQSIVYFIEQLHTLTKPLLPTTSRENIYKAMDMIFDVIDEHQLKGDFLFVDDCILFFTKRINNPWANCTFSLYISFLTITGRYRDKLKNYEILRECAIAEGRLIMTTEDVESTLTGL